MQVDHDAEREHPGRGAGGGGPDRRPGRQGGEDDRDVKEVAKAKAGLLVKDDAEEDRDAAYDGRSQQGIAKPIPHCAGKIARIVRPIVTRLRVLVLRL